MRTRIIFITGLITGIIFINYYCSAAELDKFRTKYGNHISVIMNRKLSIPRLIFGKGIPLGNNVSLTDNNIGGLAKAFIADNKDFLGVSMANIKIKKVQHIGDNWSVKFHQYFAGIPVEGGIIGISISDRGFIKLIGNRYYPGIQVSTHPSISKPQAVVIARNQYSETQRTELKNATLTLVPIELAESFEYRLAWKIKLFYHSNMLDSKSFFIDAFSGDIIRTREIFARNGINGTVEGHILLTPAVGGVIPPSTKVLYPYLNVKIHGTQYEAITDQDGNYSLPQGQPGIDQVYSTFENEDIKLQVYEFASPGHSIDEYLSTNPSWTWKDTLNHLQEYNVFYWLNYMHAHFWDNYNYDILGDQKLIVSMYGNFNGGWNSLIFNKWGALGNNIILHEYSHNVEYDLGLISIWDYECSAFGEGAADYFRSSVLNSPGNGLWDCWDLDEHCGVYLYEQYDDGNAPHLNGQIITKAMWTFRTQLGDAILADVLMLEAMSILSNFPDHGEESTKEFSNFVMALLIADDNDEDPSNGTPHQTTIFNSFGSTHHIYPSGYILSGDIEGNVDLKYDTYITGTIYVDNNATLTIEPGVIVKVADNANIVVQAGGKIEAIGTAAESITFTSADGDPQSAPNGVLCLSSAATTLLSIALSKAATGELRFMDTLILHQVMWFKTALCAKMIRDYA